MTIRTLPLNSLKVFEAAARHLSFKKAAEELCVTPAAVSRQLSHLEELIGAPLFHRFNQGVELTSVARLCLPKLQEGFECLRESVEQLNRHTEACTLTVASSPSFAMRWLMPRLHRFAMIRPDINVQVSTRLDPFGEPRSARKPAEAFQALIKEADVALMFGADNLPDMLPNLHVDALIPLSVTPLCNPRMLADARGMTAPRDVLKQMMLHDDRGLRYGKKSFWRQWLDAAGVTDKCTDGGLHFTHSLLALEAAIDGMGMVASTPILVAEELRSGRLVAPFELQAPLHCSYHAISDDATYRREDVAEFRSWLRSEISRSKSHEIPQAKPAYAEEAC